MKHHPDYELFEEIGRGQTTVVYRGHDLTLDRDVAIKELSEEAGGSDPHRKNYFLNEAKFLAQFEHENILRVYSVDSRRNWIVMEMMKATLASQIKNCGLEPELVRSVMKQTLRALDFLHRQQKIHAAVRPSNLLINDEGFVKLSDFEEAVSGGELRIPRCGNKYLAPELLRPEFGKFGPAIDLYCLGFTALELLFGPAFDSLFPATGEGAIDADVAWMRWHSSEEQLPAVREIDPSLPQDIASVLDQLLCKRVEDRPSSAAEVLKQLEDRPIIQVEVKEETDALEKQKSYGARVREIGERAAKLKNPETERRKPKSKPGKKAASKNSWKNIAQSWSKKPAVVYPLAATMFAASIGFALYSPSDAATPNESPVVVQPREPEPVEDPVVEKELVNFLISPASATLTIDGELQELEEGFFEIELDNGSGVELEVSADGYTEHFQTLSWEELAEIDFVVRVELEAEEPESRLPASLVAIEDSAWDDELSLPRRARSSKLEHSLEFVLIRPATYRIGIDCDDRYSWEHQASNFELKQPLYVAVTETTLQQFAEFADANGQVVEENWLLPAKTWVPNFNRNDVSSMLPVTNISYSQSAAFCEWIGGRLPTEHEWEASVRNESINCKQRDFQNWHNLFRGNMPEPTEAGSLENSTDLGLYDAIGNAAEWCQSQAGLPQPVVKGCSFATPVGMHVRPTWRGSVSPDGEWDVGFRVVIPVNSNN